MARGTTRPRSRSRSSSHRLAMPARAVKEAAAAAAAAAAVWVFWGPAAASFAARTALIRVPALRPPPPSRFRRRHRRHRRHRRRHTRREARGGPPAPPHGPTGPFGRARRAQGFPPPTAKGMPVAAVPARRPCRLRLHRLHRPRLLRWSGGHLRRSGRARRCSIVSQARAGVSYRLRPAPPEASLPRRRTPTATTEAAAAVAAPPAAAPVPAPAPAAPAAMATHPRTHPPTGGRASSSC